MNIKPTWLDINYHLKILTIFGTRPEAIKMAPVIQKISACEHMKSLVCVTAQHRSMLDQVLSLFEIKPDYDLEIMSPKQTLSQITQKVLAGLEPILKNETPDQILVHGDTTTTLASTLAAYYQKIPVAHVEAGLRTGDIYQPWPEEGNRILVDRLSNLHFAPTDHAKNNLLNEGIEKNKISVTGNTVIDALIDTVNQIETNTDLQQRLADQFPFLDEQKQLVLVTGHRRENFGQGFNRIITALQQLAKRDDVQIIYPVHMNENVQLPVKQQLSGISSIHLLDPLDYLPFVYLLTRTRVVLTDSGGIQEEAAALGIPVLVMRNVTERPEGIEAGIAQLVGTDTKNITSTTSALLDHPGRSQGALKNFGLYGDGRASERILNILQSQA